MSYTNPEKFIRDNVIAPCFAAFRCHRLKQIPAPQLEKLDYQQDED